MHERFSKGIENALIEICVLAEVREAILVEQLAFDADELFDKDVALELSGQNTDLDKGILDALAERSCIWFATPWTMALSR